MNIGKKDYIVIRSRRKTIGLEITEEGLLVRAPMLATRREIEHVISQHESWILKKTLLHKEAREAADARGHLTDDDIRRLTKQAEEYIPQRVLYYSHLLDLNPGKIRIKKMKSRWGSCTPKGDLSFNCLLMLAPSDVIDSVVVHELCHMLEMNHSSKFYDHVLKVCPKYRTHHAWLKKHGPVIMACAFTNAR